MSSSFVGLPQIAEFRFDDLTVNLLQEIGTEELYKIYKAKNYEKVLVQLVIKQARKTQINPEQKSKEEFLINQTAESALFNLRELCEDYYSRKSFWEKINQMTDKGEIRRKVVLAIKSKMSQTELETFGFIKRRNNLDISKIEKPFKEKLVVPEVFFEEALDWVKKNSKTILEFVNTLSICQLNNCDQNKIVIFTEEINKFRSLLQPCVSTILTNEMLNFQYYTDYATSVALAVLKNSTRIDLNAFSNEPHFNTRTIRKCVSQKIITAEKNFVLQLSKEL